MRFFLFLFLLVFLAGCVQQQEKIVVEELPQNKTEVSTSNFSQPLEIVEDSCESKFSVNFLQDVVVLGNSLDIVLSYDCATNIPYVLKMGDFEERGVVDGTGSLQLSIYPYTSGKAILSVADEQFEQEVLVVPAGYNREGKKQTSISFKKYVAQKISLDGPVYVDELRVFIRQANRVVDAEQYLLVELRKDSVDGPILNSFKLPVEEIGMNYQWKRFSINSELESGDYWVVFKISKDVPINLVSEQVYLAYDVLDEFESGDDSTYQMKLLLDEDGYAYLTEWERFPKKRIHSVIFTN